MNARAAPTKASRGCFSVTATKEIRTPKGVIKAGMNIYIDPNEDPRDGEMVLVGQNLERWNGQADIRGVVTFVGEVIA